MYRVPTAIAAATSHTPTALKKPTPITDATKKTAMLASAINLKTFHILKRLFMVASAVHAVLTAILQDKQHPATLALSGVNDLLGFLVSLAGHPNRLTDFVAGISKTNIPEIFRHVCSCALSLFRCGFFPGWLLWQPCKQIRAPAHGFGLVVHLVPALAS
jgi:integral membrane sensor domain MASE1